jgi:hypothetical protein
MRAVSFRQLALETVASDWPLMKINSDPHFLPGNSDSETGYWLLQRAVAASCQSNFTAGIYRWGNLSDCRFASSEKSLSRSVNS